MNMWHELIAKRGSSEVASCLRHFLSMYRTGAKSLVCYSDGCGGQNKNLTIVGLYSELHRTGVYDVINHKFLTRGHTFLRNDSDFAQIQKRKASATVHVPTDWCQVVREANRRNPFEVVNMDQEKFFNFKEYVNGKYKRVTAAGFRFRDGHWMNFGFGEEVNVAGEVQLVHHPDEVWLRYSYSDEEPWRKVKILKSNPRHAALQQLYHAPLLLKSAKVKDLKKIARHHLPSPQREFYLEIPNGNACGSGTEEEDCESD